MLSLLLAAAAAGVTAHADPLRLEQAVPPALLAELRAQGEIRRVFWSGENLELFPSFPLETVYTDRVREIDPLIGVEFLLLYEPPPGMPTAESEQRQLIYNALHAVSTLKGVEYFSASRDRMRIFFEEAYFVEGPDAEVPVPDPRLATEPPVGREETLYAFLDDSSLGKYVAKVSYEVREPLISMTMENHSTVRKLLIPLIRPGNLLSLVVLAPTEEGLLFYGFSCVRTMDMFGVVERKGENSFTNRLIALYNWFRATYEDLGSS